MAGRPKGSGGGVKLPESHRSKIQIAQLLNRLQKHAMGEVDMTQTQVTAAFGLLKKALPDLQSVDPETGKGGLTIHLDGTSFKL